MMATWSMVRSRLSAVRLQIPMLSRIYSSLKYRAKWARFGVYYAKSPRLKSVRVAGRRVRLSFPENERVTQEWEFGKIVFEDCYRLAEISSPVQTVLDIGANIGLFAIAARHHFPAATIHCYEPNPLLEKYLSAHCSAVRADYRMQAIGAKAGRIALRLGDGSWSSVSEERPDGPISQLSFADAVTRLAFVDVLKLDCEGAEWDIFFDRIPWTRVRSLVMEYHLWAKPNSNERFLERQLHELGFINISVCPSSRGRGFAFARKPDAAERI
jgi:FkbM family methyltransferase